MGTGNPLGPDLGAQLQSPVHLQGVTTRMPAVFTRCRATARNLAISTFSALSADLKTRALPNATRIQPPPPWERRICPGTGSHWRSVFRVTVVDLPASPPTPTRAQPSELRGPAPRGAASRHPAPYPALPLGQSPSFLPSVAAKARPSRQRGGLPEIGPGETIKKSLSVWNVAGVIPLPRISSTRLSRPGGRRWWRGSIERAVLPGEGCPSGHGTSRHLPWDPAGPSAPALGGAG